MSLILTLANVDRLENGEKTRLVLDRHGAIIGRAPNADWSLPDAKKYISSTHCEIAYRAGEYLLTDRSKNGTFVNGSKESLKPKERHTIANGDEFAIGHYRILARLEGQEAKPAAPAQRPMHEPPDQLDWGPAPTPQTWGALPSGQAVSPLPDRPRPAIAGTGALARDYDPPRVQQQDDVWSRFADANKVDWDVAGAAPPVAGAPAPPGIPPRQGHAASTDRAWTALLAAAGIDPEQLKVAPEIAASAAGSILRRLVGGMIAMLDARARARAEIGTERTTLERDGNNPLKFLRLRESPVARLINPAEPGFMKSDAAIDAAFRDLQAHQMATVAATQSALRATLAQFSPDAIRQRAESRGLLAKILPASRDAALWQAYQREFEGVVQGSDEAFMDVFAKAFHDAYELAIQNAPLRNRNG